MKIISLKCQSCGAEIQYEQGQKECKCEYCGTKIVIENAEDEGYEFEKGRQRALNEEYNNNKAQYTDPNLQYTQQSQEEPKKRRTWLWVLGWIFIFPVPLTILLLRNNTLDAKVRYGIIAAVWIVYILFGMISNLTNNDSRYDDYEYDYCKNINPISITMDVDI